MKKRNLVCKTVEYVLSKSPKEISTLTVKDIAGSLNVSTSHLSRIFSDEMGISLKKFIINEKMFIMRFLLIQNKKISIKDISQYFDFCSSDYFIKLFKEHTSMTPGQFRKLYKGFDGMEDRRKNSSDRRTSIKKVSTDRRKILTDRRKNLKIT